MDHYNGMHLDGRAMKIKLMLFEPSLASRLGPKNMGISDRKRSGGRIQKSRGGRGGPHLGGGRGGGPMRGGRGGRFRPY